MGFFSKLFKKKSTGIVSGRNPGASWTYANRFNKAKGGFAGGYGAITFKNIIEAHSDEEEIVDEFGLNQPHCKFIHPYFGVSCWTQAYNEAAMEAALLGGEVDMEEVEDNAYDYALELAEMYINGETWIPIQILDWAYYEVSSHNQ